MKPDPKDPKDLNDPTSTPAPSAEELIAEAEQRGYLRGRNEALAESLSRPAMMAEPGVGPEAASAPAAPSSPLTDDLSSSFLSHIRPSVWDL